MASFYGRNCGTSSRAHSSQNTRLTASSALELVSAEESRSMPHEKRARRTQGRVRPQYVNDENVLPYQPGMLLSDRPPVCNSNSDSDLDGGKDNIFTFSEVRSSRNNTNSELTEIKMMVQQQQAMMRAILTSQEAIQERQFV